jgi:hypothetical protein
MATAPYIDAQPQRILPQSVKTEGALISTDTSPMNLLSLALRNNAAIDVIERLAALQRDERNYQAQVSFDEALNRCQAKLTRISADASNPHTDSRYASYAKLDATVRPIYTAEGFSLSFGERDCPTPGKTRFVAFLSRAGATREFLKDISPSTKGPRGNDVMTPIHADAAADSYAKRYLLKDIFNLAIGEGDTDGNSVASGISADRVGQFCQRMKAAPTVDACWIVFKEAYSQARTAKDQAAMKTYLDLMNERKAAKQ